MCLLRQQRKKQLWIVLHFFHKEGQGGENFRKENTFRCKVKREERSLQKLKVTKRYEGFRHVHGIHKYFDSVVCPVCPTCHHCIGFWRFCMGFSVLGKFFWQFCGFGWFFFSLAVSNIPQCPPLRKITSINKFTGSFITDQAPGKLTSCKNDFACLVWLSRGRFSF